MTNFEEQVLAALARFDQRMDRLDQRLGQLDERMGRLDQRLDQLDERIGRLDQRVAHVETFIRAQPDLTLMMKTALDTNNRQRLLQRRVDDMTEVITGIRAGLNDMGATIPSTGEIAAVRDELHDIRVRLSEVEARLPPDDISRPAM